MKELLTLTRQGFRGLAAASSTTASERSQRLLDQERCGRYCNGDESKHCPEICILLLEEGECLAAMDGKLCNSCEYDEHQISPYARDFDYCPGEKVQIDFDCNGLPSPGRHDYKEGHMCGDSTKVTFGVPKRDYRKANLFGLTSINKGSSSYGSSVSSIFGLIFIMVFFLAFMCLASRMCKARREDAEDDIVMTANLHKSNGSQSFLWVSQAKGTGSVGNQVELSSIGVTS